jgi:hypothetical protein
VVELATALMLDVDNCTAGENMSVSFLVLPNPVRPRRLHAHRLRGRIATVASGASRSAAKRLVEQRQNCSNCAMDRPVSTKSFIALAVVP